MEQTSWAIYLPVFIRVQTNMIICVSNLQQSLGAGLEGVNG